LLQAGLHHLAAAEFLLKGGRPQLFDSAGYLAHMAIELMLKSWILLEDSDFPFIHPLPALVQRLKGLVPSLAFTTKEEQTIAYLSKFVQLRYPDRSCPVEIGEEDIEQIYCVADALWQQLPDELVNAYQRLPTHKKAGRVILRRPTHVPRDLELETSIKP
jgi:HEPN domain-containing protein